MRLFGHSAHQFLVVFPAGLLLAAVIFDLFALSTNLGELWTVSYWLTLAGIAGGMVAAPFGILDWLNIPAKTRAKRVGILHAVGNVLVLILFAGSWILRQPAAEATQAALTLSFVGALVLLITGWLGGELVARLSIGVDSDAYVDAPSSIVRHAAIDGGTSMKLKP